MRRSVLALTLALAACSGRLPEVEPPGDALIDLWAAVPVGMATLAGADVVEVCADPFGTWFADFGVRGVACATDQKVRLGGAAARAPVPVWKSGPHRLGAGGLALDLTNARDFGRYDPAFAAWAVANTLPRSETAVRLAQPAYDRYVRRLARIYWLAYEDLAADGFPEAVPQGAARDYAAYLDGGPVPEGAEFDGGVSVFLLFGDRSEAIADRLVDPAENVWELRYEANTAFGFWIRRRADGTEVAFHDGLRDLMTTLDPAWMAQSGS